MATSNAGPLLELMARARPTDGARPFICTADETVLSYDEFDELVASFATALAEREITTGDRVAVQLGKSVPAVALHVALLQSGAVQLPMNPSYTDAEVAALLADAEPALLIRTPERASLPGAWQNATLAGDGSGSLLAAVVGVVEAIPGVSISPHDPAAMLYTSGTTGRPKAAVLSHGNLAANANTLVQAWGFTPADHLLHILPLFHTHGLFVALHCVLASGSSLTLLEGFDTDEVVTQLPSSTVLMGVPTHYTRLLEHPGFGPPVTDGVRLFTSGSAPMTVAVHDRFHKRTGRTVLERYGMTETSMLTSNPLHGQRKPGTVGKPLPGVGLRVVDELDESVPPGTVGDLQVRGPNVFAGYWRRPDLQSTEFTGDGWFRTGDLGRVDDDGYVELVGRSKDLIITGGMNVYPTEIEDVLDSLAGVAESAVVGVPDPDLGERVVAAVVAAPGQHVDVGEVRDLCRDRLAGFKVPKQVVVVDGLPRNAMGKVEKAKMRSRLTTRDPGSSS